MQTAAFSSQQRVLPCVVDPANGKAGCSFYDADKLLHDTTHCPLASSHLMSVSLFLIPHGCSNHTGCDRPLMYPACPAAWSRGPCLAKTTAVGTQNKKAYHYAGGSL